MLKQWRTALLVGLAAAICIFISACGDTGTGSSNTPGASNGCGIAPRTLRACGKHSALIPLGGLAILLPPGNIRASTSAAGEAKNDNQEP